MRLGLKLIPCLSVSIFIALIKLSKTLQVKECVEIRIANTGRGIPRGVMKALFKEPITKKRGERGSGMGLLIAQQIVQTYNGDIRIVSPGPPEIEVAVSLPLENV